MRGRTCIAPGFVVNWCKDTAAAGKETDMQEKYSISLESLIREFALEPLALPTEAAEIRIFSNEVNRPVLPLIGFFETFDAERIQIFGKGEVRFLN